MWRAAFVVALLLLTWPATDASAQTATLPSPLWIDGGGRPTRQARAIIDVMRSIASRGLRASDYPAEALGARADTLDRTRDSARAMAFDAAMSHAVLRLLTHLHRGHLDPRTVGMHLPDAHAELDLAALVVSVSRADDVPAVVARAEPPYDGYRALLALLAHYRALDADSAARRVRQILLTIERWRWLPDAPPQRYIVVNIPAFRLYAFENDATASHPVQRMDVIVGSAREARYTPVFSAAMREVVFRPYWEVPPSIARRELLPRIRRRPSTLAAEALEIVRIDDDGVNARRYAPTAANLASVVSGSLRLRQRPGGSNALGPAKFLFPNPYNVYLHGTPAQELFARARRDFSHGCIRVADPAALAAFVLAGQAPWDSSTIAAAMSSNGAWSRRVPLARPLMVFVLYATVVIGDDGAVHFYRDVYGHDATLARALGLPSR